MTRRFPGATLLAVLAIALAACAGPGGAGPGATAAQPAPPDHVWRSDGYGWIVTLTGGRERTYETTAISCLPDTPLDQVGRPAADGTVSYGRAADPDAAAVPILTVRQGGPDGTATLHLMGSAADVDLLPLPGLPPACSRPVAADPVTTFDVFWQTMAENYNSFARKHVDWSAQRDRYRPMVTAGTTPEQLFSILRQMITPLGDAHVEIDGPHGDSFTAKRPGTRDEDDVSRGDATKAVDHYLSRALEVDHVREFAHDRIGYADLPGGRGYLRITSFEEYGGKNSPFVTSSAVLARVLDTVFTEQRVHSWRGLVIDVRFNTGGDDALGLQVAGRLTGTPYVAYRKQPRDDPADPAKHGRLQTVMVTPTPGAAHYTGPIALLTSDLTVSAGETFTEALLGRTPAPARIGATTQGVFSDDMTRALPNGWKFTLGNEEYFDGSGHDYEGAGIPPEVTTPVFTPDELDQHLDSALSAALTPP